MSYDLADKTEFAFWPWKVNGVVIGGAEGGATCSNERVFQAFLGSMSPGIGWLSSSTITLFPCAGEVYVQNDILNCLSETPSRRVNHFASWNPRQSSY